MSPIAGMTPTGRTMLGPASDLVEMADSDGVVHTAIVFHPEWRQHPAITDALGVILGFLESPLVTGLVELVDYDPSEGAFVYPTGRVRSAAELVRALSDTGRVGGVRAGLELMYTAGQILVEGAEAGESQGVCGHGGLTPHRIMIKPDGQVMVIGYGLPQVEILQFHDDRSQVPREDSFRYCPPERIEGRTEALSSDLFGLGLIAFEVMTGKPVYDGLVNDIRQQAARGEGSRRLFRFREVLPEGVRNVLTKVLRPDEDARYISGEDFLADVHALLADRSVPGNSLLGLMDALQSSPSRSGGVLPHGSTQMVAADELRDQLAAEPTVKSEPIAEPPEDSSNPTTPSHSAEFADRDGSEDAEPRSELTQESDPTEEPSSKRWSKVTRQARRVRRLNADPVSQPPDTNPTPPDEPDPGGTPDGSTPVPEPPRVPRRPRRATESVSAPRPSTSNPSDPPAVPGSPATTADDLLVQIRGGPKGATPTPDASLSERTSMFKRGEVMEVTLEDADSDDSATMMMTPEQLRAKLAANIEPESGPKGIAPPVARPDHHAVQVMDPQGNRHTVPIESGDSVAGAIVAMVGRVVPLPLDQMGGLQGWYRLCRDGKRIDPRARSVELTGRPTQLEWVPSGTRVVEVSVRSGSKDVRFSNPMGTTVPVRSLVIFLAEWLSLPAGDWGMHVQGDRLDDGAILADFQGTGPISVELRLPDS